jgi:uncharacterized protein
VKDPGRRKGADVSEGLTIDIQVIPRASRVAVGGRIGERLRVAVTAPPVDGAANAAVMEALAEAFGLRPRDVTILRGQTGKRKTVRVAGGDAGILARLFADRDELRG